MSNKKTLIASIIVSALFLILANLKLLPGSSCDSTEFGCVGTGIGFAFVYLFIIPVIFGILGFTLSGEHRAKQAFSSFGIALIVALAGMAILYVNLVDKSNTDNGTAPAESGTYPAKGL